MRKNTSWEERPLRFIERLAEKKAGGWSARFCHNLSSSALAPAFPLESSAAKYGLKFDPAKPLTYDHGGNGESV